MEASVFPGNLFNRKEERNRKRKKKRIDDGGGVMASRSSCRAVQTLSLSLKLPVVETELNCADG